MIDKKALRTPHELTRKWHALAERRREHLLELYQSGRWKRYYDEPTFLAQMREAVAAAEDWSKVVDPDKPSARPAMPKLAMGEADRNPAPEREPKRL